jgi:hypothetical protein
MAMNAICCDILRNEHGLDVWFGCRGNPCDREFPEILAGVPCYSYAPNLQNHPLRDNDVPRGFEGGVDHTGTQHPFDFILDFRYSIGSPLNTLFQCLREFGVLSLTVPCAGLRVQNLAASDDRYDVVLCTNSGGWKPVRGYRRGAELAECLRQRGLTVCDLAQRNIQRDFGLKRLLSLVQQARLYIGVETGPTHVVSGVHRRALVIQSGIHVSAFWNVYDRTHVVEADWSCGGRQCQVRRHEQCTIPEGVCIDRFAPEHLADLALELLKDRHDL